MQLFSKVIWSLLAVTISVVLLYLCLRQVDLTLLLQDIEHVRRTYLFAAWLCIVAMIGVAALEWRLLIPAGHRVSINALLRIVALMVMIQNSLHHFAGHAFAIFQLGSRQRLTKSGALSILATDQLAEGFARLTVWGLLALVIDLPHWAVQGLRSVVWGVGCLYAVLLVFAWTHHKHDGQQVLVRPSAWKRLTFHLAQWAHNLRGVRDPRITLGAIALALTKKFLRATAVYCVQCSLGVELPIYAPLLVVGALDLATMVSVTPGHLGIFEATVFFTYQYLGVEPTVAMTMALFEHLVFLLAMVLPGVAVSLRWGFHFSTTVGQAPEILPVPQLAKAVRHSQRIAPAAVGK